MTTLTTPRLVLRRARADDLAAMHAVLSEPRAMAHWSTLPHRTLDETRAWLAAMIDSPKEVSDDYVVEIDGRVVGKAGFWRLPEIGYILHPDVWGLGVATEALTAVLDHVFAARCLDAAIADVDPANSASIRVLQKLGFRETRRAANTWFIGGRWFDSVYFALQRGDWLQRR